MIGLCSGAFGARASKRRALGAEITELTPEFLWQFFARVGDDFHRGFAQHTVVLRFLAVGKPGQVQPIIWDTFWDTILGR